MTAMCAAKSAAQETLIRRVDKLRAHCARRGGGAVARVQRGGGQRALERHRTATKRNGREVEKVAEWEIEVEVGDVHTKSKR